MDSDVANSLNPIIPSTDSLDWVGVFKKVSIFGDEDIPINKRGSGVKRLILLSFFRAEAERRMIGNENANIIYAVEEPETSQHTENQKLLVKAFLELAKNNNTQVIITTHSATIVKELDYDNLPLITSDNLLRTVSPVIFALSAIVLKVLCILRGSSGLPSCDIQHKYFASGCSR